jgi:hypothetical protein
MADDYIPHDDPRRAKNFAAWHEGSHSATKTDGGSPRVYYHGSNQKLDIIRPGMKDPGAWFTTNLKNAANYARGDDAHVHKVYLKSENPMVVPFDYDENDNLHAFHNGEKIPFSDNVSIVKYAQQNGYDGVHFPHGNFTEEDDTFVVFNPEQIKSATGNNGNFDATEPDINKARGGSTFSAVDTDHPAFRSWFGKSVLHNDGVPRTYYHGTSKDIDFKKFKMSRHGIWMTSEPEDASQYALENDSQGFKRDGWDLKRSNTASRVIPVHARIENPFVGSLPQEYAQNNYKKSQSDWFDVLRANGYDGWVPESQNGKLAVALGHPGQIKSALSNSGEYSETGDINKAGGGVVDDQQQRELNPLGFYSHAAEMASQLPQERGSPQQMAGMLTNKYGVKPVEMEGFNEAFAGQPSVTRDQLVQHFTNNMPQIERKVLGEQSRPPISRERYDELNTRLEREQLTPAEMAERKSYEQWTNNSDGAVDGPPTKYSQYQLPGGENYREVLLKMPEGYGASKEALADLSTAKERAASARNAYNSALSDVLEGKSNISDEALEALSKEENIANARVRNFEKLAKGPAFQSSHWRDDPNVLAHIRMADRTGPNNEKILHVEEIQSDWGQKGKKEGFKDQNKSNLSVTNEGGIWRVRDPNGQRVDLDGSVGFGSEEQARNAIAANTRDISGVPTAPYVTNTAAWTDLALKHVLHEAAHGDYDKVVWTPGAEQAKRYDLSKQISRLVLENDPAGGHKLRAYSPSGDQVINKRIVDADRELPDLIGKDVAKKLLDQDLVNPKVFNEKLTNNDIIVVPKEGRYQISAPWGWSTHVGMGVANSPEAAAEYGARYFSNLAKEANSNMGTSHATEYKNATRSLVGQDLSVGGEGMKGYYDKIVPTQLSKLLKKLDPEARIEAHNLDTRSPADKKMGLPEGQSINTVRAQSIRITPKMRESIKRGLPTYADGGTVEHFSVGGGTFEGHKTPDAKRLARVADKFIYHSGTVDQLPDMRYGLEPQHGDWIKELSKHAGDIDPQELLDRSTPLVWMSDDPSWVSMKVARKIGKHPQDVTEQDIREHGHLAMIPRKGDHAEHIWKVGDEGLSNGAYSTVTNLNGRKAKAYETDLYDSDMMGQKEPFGVERNEYISAQPVEPMFHLTGDDLVDFLKETSQIKKADGGAVDDEDEGLTAYHGSPYDFEQFDTSKIGTGHGTQAYGHGLYLAESEPIAKGYADAAEDKYSPNSIAVRMLKGWGSHETAIQKQKEHIQKLEGSHNEDFIAPYRGALQILESGTTPKVGHMYEVRIKAHPDHFLDWDAPLSEQSEYVKSALSNRAGLFEPGSSYDGKKLYRMFEDMHGDDSARASQELAKAGIKGIKYFAHALSEGSQNYVVFNHDHVQVKRKYAQGGAIDET